MSAVLNCFADDFELPIRGHSNIENFDFRILEHLFERFMHSRDISEVRNHLSNFWGSRSNADNIESRIPVRSKLHIAHNEAGTDSADSEIAPRRLRRDML